MLKNQSLGLVESLQTVCSLKDLKRQGWLQRGVPSRLCESVAGHCYRTAQAGFHYTHDLQTMTMLLIHDWPESMVGDITPRDAVDPAEKSRLETEAMRSITNPLLYGNNVMNLWLEYEHGVTPRARIAKQLDKLDAAVMAFVYENLGFPVSEFFPYARERLHDPALIHVFDRLARREHDLSQSHRVYFSLLAEARRSHDTPSS